MPRKQKNQQSQYIKPQNKKSETKMSKSIRSGIYTTGNLGSLPRFQMPDQADAFIKANLDPSHIPDVRCEGIPDDTSDPTRTYIAYANEAINLDNLKWMYYKGNDHSWSKIHLSNMKSWAINGIYIVQNGMVGLNFLVICVGTTTDTSDQTRVSVGYYTSTTDLSSINNGYGVRTVGKGMTITNVGERMYRGGYFSCYSTTKTTVPINNGDATSWYIDLTTIANSQVEGFDGDQGVYAVLKPVNRTNFAQFQLMDDTEDIAVRVPDATNGATINVANTSSSPLWMSWNCNIVQYIPPSPVSSNSTINWKINVKYSTLYEYRVPPALGTDHVINYPPAINTLFAILEYHSSFYPASFNDFRSVMSKVYNTYQKNKQLVDAVAGVIPLGSELVNVAEGLLSSYLKTKPKQRKQLARTL